MRGNGTTAANIEKMIALRDQKAIEVADLDRRLLTAKGELAGYDKMLAAGGVSRPGMSFKQKPGRKPGAAAAAKAAAAKAATPAKNKGERKRRPKVMVKEIVMEIVATAGDEGITLHEVVAETDARGRPLPIDAVQRFLQRFKNEGHLICENGRYKLAA